jgi:HK97 family phage major capsid protein
MAKWEARALTLTTTAGGYLVSPEMNRALEEARLFYGPMLQLATVIRTDTGAILPFPTYNGTATKGRILGINTQVTATDPAFGQMNLGAFKYSSDMVLVPEELIQDSGVPLSDFLGRALGERIGRILNEHFTTGAGTTLPFGVVVQATAVNLGVGTAAGFGSTTDGTAFRNILKLLHAVDIAYRNGGESVGWMMNDQVLQVLAGMTDSTGRPLWVPSLVAGEPDRLLGYRIFINNDMTATFANNARTVLFGDFSKYMIREVRDIAILSSRERFIDFHQTAFLAFGRYDGNLLNAGTGPVKAAVHQT